MSPNPDPNSPPPPTGDLQFQTAETLDTRKRCAACSTVLEETFYQIQGVDVCGNCAAARRAGQDLPDGNKKFLRALAYGSGAALLGWVGWSAVEIITGFQIGLLAIAVGWMVGTAIRKGTEGHTSRKYQIMAVILTYLAISMSFLPILIADQIKKRNPAAQQQKKAEPAVTVRPDTPLTLGGFFVALVMLLGLALISPLLGAIFNFPMGLISVFIVYLALQRAWQLTQPDDAVIAGPFAIEPAG
jgi:hypothetical protein